jgi:hypothetical protein
MSNYQQKYNDTIPLPPLPLTNETRCQRCRLKCFYYCLETAPRTANAEQTIQLINNTIRKIENDYSGIAENPNPSLKSDGRMYPIQDDYIDRKTNGVIVALTRGNRIIIDPNGSFKILDRRTEDLLLEKN